MQQTMTAQGRHLPARRGPRAGGRRAAGTAGTQPQHRRALARRRRQPGAGDRVPHAEDAEARGHGRLRRASCARRAAARTIREDYPRRNDAEWLKRTLASWTERAGHAAHAPLRALDVKTMELPPGWRGYGAKDYTDHPDTPARQKEVEAIRAKLAPAGPLRRAGGAHAVRGAAAAALPRSQRTHRREVLTDGRRSHAPHAHAPDPPLQPAGARPARRACSPISSKRPTA